MRATETILTSLNLPARDAYDLPASRKRFADGGRYRIYPSGQHIESTVVALSRERVRRAAIGLALLRRYSPDAIASPVAVRV